MDTAKHSNRDALIGALRVYVKAMYPFTRKCLGEQEIKEFLRLPPDSNIEENIEVKDISRIINERDYWRDYFQEKFKIIDRDDIRYYDARSVTRLIMMGRNQVSHDELRELDPEFTRTQLFLIIELLGKVNRPDKQREVEAIRDELFSDDTAERLAEAEERLKDVETENAEDKKSLEEAEARLKTVEAEKIKHEKDNTKLSKQIDDQEKRVKKLSRQLKNAKSENDKHKKNLAGTKQRLEKSEAAQVSYKERLETTSKELKDTKNELAAVEAEKTAHQERLETTAKELEEAKREWSACEENLKSASDRLEDAIGEWMVCMKRLAAMRNLFTIATIGNQAVQRIYPPFETDAAVRILDRRETNKQNYLLNLLEQEESTIIYVQSEEKIDQLLTLVGPEKAALIGKHDAGTSEAEETEILKKLERGELMAVVSNTTFSTLTASHSVEHFVFSHLVPGLDAFFERCQPAFTSEKHTYLHLIYNNGKDVEGLNQWLAQKYPNKEALRRSYRELKELAEANGGSVKLEAIYNTLDMVELGIETGLTTFEELGFVERDGRGIITPLLSPVQRELEESATYRGGEKLKKETAEFLTFQLEHSIAQIWAKTLEKLNVDSEQILRERNVRKESSEVSEMEDNVKPAKQTEQDSSATTADDTGAQETLMPFDASQQHASNVTDDADSILIKESDVELHSSYGGIENAVDGDSTVQSEQSTEAVDCHSTVDDETSETSPAPKPSRANAKVTEDQVREIRARNEAGESYNQLAKAFSLSSAAVRNIALRKTWKDVE